MVGIWEKQRNFAILKIDYTAVIACDICQCLLNPEIISDVAKEAIKGSSKGDLAKPGHQ